MSDLPFLSGDLHLTDVDENVGPAHQTLKDLLNLPSNMQHLSVEQKKKAKIFSKTLEHDTLKKNLQSRIAQYMEPKHTKATLRQKNNVYQKVITMQLTQHRDGRKLEYPGT